MDALHLGIAISVEDCVDLATAGLRGKERI